MAQGPGTRRSSSLHSPSKRSEQESKSCRIRTSGESLELDAARDFNEQVTLALREIVDSGSWSRITFVAKSRGTLYLAAMSESLPCERVDAIWVTPLLGLDYVRNGVLSKAWRSLIVAGGADPYHDRGAHDAVCNQLTASELVIENADHGLVVGGDVRKTVDGFKALAEASLAFASSTV